MVLLPILEAGYCPICEGGPAPPMIDVGSVEFNSVLLEPIKYVHTDCVNIKGCGVINTTSRGPF